MAFNIDPLDNTTIEAAGALVAREHTVARDLYPALSAAFGDPDTCTVALQHLRDNGYTGAVAVDRGRTVGVMTLAAMTGLVYGAYARLAPDGFAVAPDLDDPTTLLARLYSELAPRFLAGGMLQYFLDHVSLAPLSESLANLGFGRHHVYASQAAAARSHSTNVRIRVGGSADLDSIARLAQVEIEHRATPPIYAPPDARSLDSITDMHRGLLERGAVHFIAALDRRDVGLLTVELTSPAPRLCADGQPYIGPTARHPDARGRGVGRALVDAALSWADDHGYHWVSVDFEPANPLSRPFWMGNGFQPIGYGVLRSIHPAHLPTRG